MIYNLCGNKILNGKIQSKKMLTLKEFTLGNFMYNVYFPSLDKYIYHVHYVKILSKNLCGKLRYDACYSKPGTISSIRD